MATRNSCFALISGIERDFRDFLMSHSDFILEESFFPQDLVDVATSRYNKDNKKGASPLDRCTFDLIDYIDFADIAKLLHLHKNILKNSISIRTIENAAESLLFLTPCRNRVCHTKPLESDDFLSIVEFAEYLMTEKEFKNKMPHTRNVLSELRNNPTSLLGVAIPNFWNTDEDKIAHNLPIPDFDETGFLGRQKNRKDVLNLIKTNHPVITIVGEGGVGKTALALRCLYDLVDANDPSLFEVIIWSSSKTTMLSAGGVQSIKNSIRNTLELYENIAQELGSPNKTIPVEDLLLEIKEYLASFKVLLVIDNLETLSNHNLRLFLLDIPKGSKVMITSRVGLGEVEIRYPLDNLDNKTAVDLARRYSSSLNLDVIKTTKESLLVEYCQRLFNNPLLIKWFVASVSMGVNPNSLLDRKNATFKEALSFCYTNLFDKLKDEEKQIVHILSSAKRPLSITEFIFIAKDYSREHIELSLQGLHNASMIIRVQDREKETILYSLTSTAQEYVSLFSPPPSKVFGDVHKSIKELRVLRDSEKEKIDTYKYDIFALNRGLRSVGTFRLHGQKYY